MTMNPYICEKLLTEHCNMVLHEVELQRKVKRAAVGCPTFEQHFLASCGRVLIACGTWLEGFERRNYDRLIVGEAVQPLVDRQSLCSRTEALLVSIDELKSGRY
jgi:hypothetical protein